MAASRRSVKRLSVRGFFYAPARHSRQAGTSKRLSVDLMRAGLGWSDVGSIRWRYETVPRSPHGELHGISADRVLQRNRRSGLAGTGRLRVGDRALSLRAKFGARRAPEPGRSSRHRVARCDQSHSSPLLLVARGALARNGLDGERLIRGARAGPAPTPGRCPTRAVSCPARRG